MIALQRVSKRFATRAAPRIVVDDVTIRFRAGVSVAILGRNGAGKSTLLKLISGALAPDRGRILRQGSVSWPVGFAGSFHPELSGAQNTRFIARVHGVRSDALVDFVRVHSGLGDQLGEPVRSYSSGMRSRLAFAVSMGFRFDMYLVDEITAVGDAAFKAQSEAMLQARLRTSGALIVTHGLVQAQRLCQHVAILDQGRLRYFEDMDRGVAQYQSLIRAG